jgi:NAD(P)H-flavin reductase
VPMALHFVPARELHKFPHEAQQAIPMLRMLTKELEKYPNTEFVEVRDAETHVRVRTVGSKVVVDVVDPENTVHVACPLAMIQDVVESLGNIREDADHSRPTV